MTAPAWPKRTRRRWRAPARAARRADPRRRCRASRGSGCSAGAARRRRSAGRPAGPRAALVQAIAQGPHPRALHPAAPACARAHAWPKPTHSGVGRVPGPQPALLAAAREQRREPHAAPHVQRADALGAVQLVRREAHQIDARAPPRRAGPCRRPGRHRYAGRCRAHGTALAISAIGWSTPISWLAVMIETRAVSGRSACAQLGPDRSGRPAPPAARSPRSRRARSARQVSSTQGCSVTQVTTCRRAPAVAATPRIARLFASVAPEVNTISSGRAPISAGDLGARAARPPPPRPSRRRAAPNAGCRTAL